MNKAFLIILVPAIAVSVAWLTVGWGTRVSAPVGIAMLIVLLVCIFLVLRRQGQKPEANH